MEDNYIEYNGVLVPKSSIKTSLNMGALSDIHKKQEQELKRDVKEIRNRLNIITDRVYRREEQNEYRMGMEIERKVKKEHFYSSKCFFVPNFEYAFEVFGEDIYDKGLGLLNDFNNPAFSGRFVYPIMDFNSNVMGFISYDKYHEIKYIVSKTYGFGKSNSFYGMHLMRWIYSCGYVVVQEGIVDCYSFWEEGIPAISLNGNSLSKFIVRMLKRFGYNVILIPDNDEAGRNSLPYWQKELPEASVIKLVNYKDSDELRIEHGMAPLKEAIKSCLNSAMIKQQITLTLTV